MDRLKKRAQFLAVAQGARTARRAFVLQALCERPAESPARFGFTVTKRIGNAVERNRIRRRLRAAVDVVHATARTGCDYVLVGRRDALTQPFPTLVGDLASALRKVHDPRSQTPNRSQTHKRSKAPARDKRIPAAAPSPARSSDV
ncbi:MAG: ribonuclease P protein component [Hyphomicrobiales bacterium]|nr:MAG: ribonuclease P protein component [Hyphomicrobiales bacterium]